MVANSYSLSMLPDTNSFFFCVNVLFIYLFIYPIHLHWINVYLSPGAFSEVSSCIAVRL